MRLKGWFSDWAVKSRRLGCAFCVSTGIHTVALLAMGLLVVAQPAANWAGPAMIAFFAPAHSDQALDAPLGSLADQQMAVVIEAGQSDSAAAVAEDAAGLELEDAFQADDPSLPLPELQWNGQQPAGAAAPAAKGSPRKARAKPAASADKTAAAAKVQGGAGALGKPDGAKLGGGAGSTFFGLEAAGNKIVFVVDVSGSMNGKRFRRLRRELRHSIEALSPSQQFFVVLFNHQAMPMPATDLLQANPTNVALAEQWLAQVSCGGGTNPLPGVLLALQLHPDSIFLLTDGKFDPQTVWAVAQAEPPQPIPVHTICFASKTAEKLLKAIAEETGGGYQFVK